MISWRPGRGAIISVSQEMNRELERKVNWGPGSPRPFLPGVRSQSDKQDKICFTSPEAKWEGPKGIPANIKPEEDGSPSAEPQMEARRWRTAPGWGEGGGGGNPGQIQTLN